MKKYLFLLSISFFALSTVLVSCSDDSVPCNCSSQRDNSVQCKGETQDGNRCGNNTLNECGYCYLHTGQC